MENLSIQTSNPKPSQNHSTFTKIIIIIILVVLLGAGIAGVIFLIKKNTSSNAHDSDSHDKDKHDKDTHDKDNHDKDSQSTVPTLYLLPEANKPAFKRPDTVMFKTDDGKEYLVDPDVVKNNFSKIAVIANTSQSGWINMYKEKEILNLQNATNLPIEKWLSFYFDIDGPLCQCRVGASTKLQKQCFAADGSGDPGYSEANCLNDISINGKKQKSVVNRVYDMCKQVGDDLVGIMFDDEEGTPTMIVQAMEAVKDMWDKTHTKKLKLGWSLEVRSGLKDRPRDVDGKYTWDISLGQAYTDQTTDLYNGDCTVDYNKWWKNIGYRLKGQKASKGIPMVCGAGNCIGDDNKCIDERLSGQIISNLIANRPKDFEWKNFGIWYGTYPKKGKIYPSKEKTKHCYNQDFCGKCRVGCCKDWELMQSGGKNNPELSKCPS